MGIDKITKLLKRCNKGKNTITMGIVVAFLLGSSSSYGDIRIEVVEESGKNVVKIFKDGVLTSNFGEIIPDESNNNIFTWKYNGVLSEEIILDDSLFNGDIIFNIENNGIIAKQIGNKNSSNIGNGIGIYSETGKTLTLGNILNNGIIAGSEGTSSNQYSNIGNGIGIYNNQGTLTLGNILNNGIIKGNESTSSSKFSSIENGIGIYNNQGTLTLGNILNNGIIQEDVNEKTTGGNTLNIGNGIGFCNDQGTLTLGDIKNNGIVEGKGNINLKYYYYTSSIGNGIGIYNNSGTLTLEENIIENNGIVKGNETVSPFDNVGNGIGFYNRVGKLTLGDILNNGTVTGSGCNNKVYSNTGNGIGIYNYNYLSDKTGTLNIKNILNNGIAKGNENNSSTDNSNIGNGIGIYNNSYKGTLTLNIGNIKNNGLSQGNRNGLLVNNTGTISDLNILNSGLFQGNENGIKFSNQTNSGTANLTLENMLNSGLSQGKQSGIYIDNYAQYSEATSNLTIKNILNSGLTQGNENGIYVSNSSNRGTANLTLENISNIGTIIGETGSGVKFEKVDTDKLKDKYFNYGVVVGKIKNDGTNTNGIYITLDNGSGSPIIEIGNSGEVKDILQFDEKGEQITDTDKLKNYYVINAQLDNTNTATTTTINSSELDKKIENNKLLEPNNPDSRKNFAKDDGSFSNLIINGAENTLTIGTNNTQTSTSDENLNNLTISNSVINSYKNSVVFGASGGTLSGTNLVVNTGSFDDSFAIKGAEGTDNIILDSSIINGKIDLENGDTEEKRDIQDKLEISNGTTINGDIKLNNDTFTATSSIISSSSDDNDNNTSEEMENKTTINGDIQSKDSKLLFTDTIVNGNIDINGGTLTAISSTFLSKGTDSNTTTKTIFNGDITSTNSNLSFENSILNGSIKLENGETSTSADNSEISNNLTINNSTVNGGITLSKGSEGTITGITSVVNALEKNILVDGGKLNIVGVGQRQRFNVGATTVNGNITVKNNGVLSLGNNTMINGDINFENTKNVNLKIDKDMLINGNVTADSTATTKNLELVYNLIENESISTKEIFQKHLKAFSTFNNVHLADKGNTVDLRGIDFKFNGTLIGGDNNDLFTIDSFDIFDFTRDKIVISDDSTTDKDRLTLTFALGADKEQENNKKLQKFENIEYLQLADKENTINVSGLSFKNILGGSEVDIFNNISSLTADSIEGGNGDDIFNDVSQDKLGIIFGGAGENDTINMESSLNIDENNSVLYEVAKHEIEKINLVGNDTLTINSIEGLEKLTVNFGEGNNKLTVKNISGEEFTKSKFYFDNGENDTLNVLKDNIDKVFDYDLTGVETVVLGNDSSQGGAKEEWKISLGSNALNGVNNFNLNGNILNFGEAIISGENLKFDDSFTKGAINFSNGTIKFALDENITFANGSKTEYTFNTGDKILIDSNSIDFSLDNSYAFLNVDKNGVSVLDWKTLVEKAKFEIESSGGTWTDNDYLNYNGNYEIALKDFNKEGHVSFTEALKHWTAKEIVEGIKADYQISKEYTFEDNSSINYTLVAEKDVTIDSEKGEIKGLTFNTSSFQNINIKNEHSEGNIIFNESTSIKNINAESSTEKLTLDFNGNTKVEDINFGNANENIVNFNNSTSVGNISFGTGNKNTINISDALNIQSMGAITAQEGGAVQINIDNISKGGNDGFNHVLAGANAGENNSVIVKDINENEINIRTNYGGELTLNKKDKKEITTNISGMEYMGYMKYTGTILFGNSPENLTDKNKINIYKTEFTGKILSGNESEISIGDNNISSIFNGSLALGNDSRVDIKNSVVNENGTIELGADGKISLENSHINGLKVNTSNNNSVNITIGDNNIFEDKGLSLGKGDDTATLNLTDKNIKNIRVIVNGGANSGAGDSFNVGENSGSLKNADEFNNFSVLTGNITDFENININENITFGYNSENSLQISGTNKITIADGKALGLQINYKEKNESTGKVIGHALYNKDNKIDVISSNGKIYISTEGAGNEQTIDFSNVNLDDFEKENILLGATTVSHNLKVIENDDGTYDIEVRVSDHILGENEAVKYDHLDRIYQSIVSANKITYMDKSTTLTDKGSEQEAIDEAIKAQLEYYGKIYHSSPYAYSNEVSKKSAELITNSLLENKVMPDLNKWTFGGSIAGREADSDNNFYGANYYGVDDTKAEVDINSRLYGAYAFGEYGLAENKSIGFAIAGTNGTTDISGGSKLESNAVFVSAYAKQNLGNLSLMAGLGYQHSFYDSTRVASNDYQSTTVDKKYEDDLFTIFAGARYVYNLGNGFSLEPNAKLNISHVMQNDIDENDNKDEITIEVDSQDFTSIDTEIGVDVVKQINTEKGKLSFKAGVSLVYALEGYEDEFLNARVVGATEDFEIISPESDRARVKFNLGTEYELENGMFYNLHGNYITSSHDTDYSISFGAGYKF